jgi:rhodanese-related sulfurtransferase
MSMNRISRDELKAKLDRGDQFKLVMVLGQGAYNDLHIPGSICVSTPEEALELLKQDDEIIVYCTGGACVASLQAYRKLTHSGYTNVTHYPGGLAEWEEAGYPLEGRLTQ